MALGSNNSNTVFSSQGGITQMVQRNVKHLNQLVECAKVMVPAVGQEQHYKSSSTGC